MASDAQVQETGFGYDPVDQALSFVLNIPRDEEEAVRLIRRRPDAAPQPNGLLSISVPQSHWNMVESRLRVHFNQRLRSSDKPQGVWRFGDNLLSHELGRELAVLFYAIESVDLEHVLRAYGNWRRLTSEERQWLYNRVANAAPQSDPEVGWRRAIQIALLEERAPEASMQPASNPTDALRANLPRERESAAVRRRKDLERAGQLRLL